MVTKEASPRDLLVSAGFTPEVISTLRFEPPDAPLELRRYHEYQMVCLSSSLNPIKYIEGASGFDWVSERTDLFHRLVRSGKVQPIIEKGNISQIIIGDRQILLDDHIEVTDPKYIDNRHLINAVFGIIVLDGVSKETGYDIEEILSHIHDNTLLVTVSTEGNYETSFALYWRKANLTLVTNCMIGNVEFANPGHLLLNLDASFKTFSFHCN